MKKSPAPVLVRVLFGLLFTTCAAQTTLQSHVLGCSGGNAHDSNGQYCCSGTLGALLTDGNKLYVLSNNHVLGILGGGKPGDPISQPGLLDNSCRPGRTVANLTLALPLSTAASEGQLDAAIAEIVNGELESSGRILNLGIPGTKIVQPSKNLPVTKMGRTTGVTSGLIKQTVFNVNVDYSNPCHPDGPTIQFKNLILIDGANNKPFSGGGDSGALVVTTSGHNPVGLLIAGNGTQSLAHPISTVLDALSAGLGRNLTLVASGPTSVTVQSQSMAVLSPSFKKLLDAKDRLWEAIRKNHFVIGVGVSSREDNPDLFQITVYVRKNSRSSLTNRRLPGFLGPKTGEAFARFLGHRVEIVETNPFQAYPEGAFRAAPSAAELPE